MTIYIIQTIKKVVNRVKMETKPWGFIYGFIIFPIKIMFKRIGFGHKYYKKICYLKNKYKGERCFIIATGPSLNLCDVEKLKNEYTIAVNTIFKYYPNTDWRPTYYVLTDPCLAKLLIKNEITSFNDFAKEYCIFNRLNKKDIRCSNAIFIDNNWLDHVYQYGKSKKFVFNLKLELGVYDFYSVTQESILYAIYMGFKEIYILGADNNYTGRKKHFAKINGEPTYSYEQAIKMQLANDYAYSYLKEKADELGIKIVNVTRGGNIKAFPKVDLEKVI